MTELPSRRVETSVAERIRPDASPAVPGVPLMVVQNRRARRLRPSQTSVGRGLFARRGDAEADPLRERQLAARIDRVGLASHVRLPRVATGFAATARFLLAAERAADLGARRAEIHVSDATV